MAIRWRITLWYLAAFTLLSILLAGLFYWQTRRSLLIQTDQTLLLATSLALESVETGFAQFEDKEMLSRSVNDIDNDLSVLLIDETGVPQDIVQNSEYFDDSNREDKALSVTESLNRAVTVAEGEQRWRVYSTSLSDGRWIQVKHALDAVEDVLDTLLVQLLWALPVAVLFAGGGGYWLAGIALRPVDQMTRTAQLISAEDFSQRIGYEGVQDEIGRLATTFDSMLDRLQTSFSRERRFTSDAAHELRTPLTALKGNIEVTLADDVSAEQYRAVLYDMGEQVERLIKLSTNLLFMARFDQHRLPETKEVIAIDEFMPAIVEFVQPLAEEKGVTLRQRLPTVEIFGYPDLLIQLFLNLLDNAIKYTPEGGGVEVSAEATPTHAIIHISDTGIGISEKHLALLFDRFYRVEQDRSRLNGSSNGSGLGLAIAREIALAHDGEIVVATSPGEGSKFSVALPREPLLSRQLN